ncbi:MAG: hypothetical protein AAFP77_23685 [Bacteroidota bacterium]
MVIWLLIIVLLFLAWEDWQHRSVSVWSLVVYGLLALLWFFPLLDWSVAVVNLSFLLLQSLLVLLYFKIRKGSAGNVFGGMLGWGDVVFIAISATVFATLPFLAAYILGLIATLLVVLLTGKYRIPGYSIPLISGLAASHIVVLLYLYLWVG